MSKCASCKYITFDVIRGDRCFFTGKRVNNGKYCNNYEMLCDTEEKSIEENNARMISVIELSKRR